MSTGRADDDIGPPSTSGGPEAAVGPAVRTTPLERAMLALCCVAGVLIFALSLADIVLRAASVEFFMAGEANGILLAWMVFLALPYVTRTGSHISLDFVDQVAPDWLRAGFRIFGYLVMIVYVVVLSWYCGQLTWTSFVNDVRSSSILRWPVVYAQVGVMLGLVLLAATQCLILIADVRSGGRVHPPQGARPS